MEKKLRMIYRLFPTAFPLNINIFSIINMCGMWSHIARDPRYLISVIHDLWIVRTHLGIVNHNQIR